MGKEGRGGEGEGRRVGNDDGVGGAVWVLFELGALFGKYSKYWYLLEKSSSSSSYIYSLSFKLLVVVDVTLFALAL